MLQLSHPVGEDDSAGAGAGGEVVLAAVDQQHHMLDVLVHAALLAQVQLVQTLLLPLDEAFLHFSAARLLRVSRCVKTSSVRKKRRGNSKLHRYCLFSCCFKEMSTSMLS